MYKLILNKVFKYQLIISGYTKTDSLSFRTTDIINIITALKVYLFTTTTIRINSVMDILSIKTIHKPTPIINLPQFKLTSVSKIRGKISSIINVAIILESLAQVKVKLLSIITFPINIVATAIVGRFYKLAEHDSKTLGDMDVFILRDLDYIEY